MLSMLRRICRVDQDVIHVHKLVQEGFQHPIRHSLESRRCIRQPKAQNLELEMTLWGAEGRFVGHIRRCDPDLVVARGQVQGAKHLCTLQLVKTIVDPWQRINDS